MRPTLKQTFGTHVCAPRSEEHARVLGWSRGFLGSGLRVLDLGCGTGEYLATPVREGIAARAVGVDVSAANIRVARERSRGLPIEFREADYFDEVFDEPFDAVVANSSLQYQPVRMEKLARDLKEGGILLAYTPHASRANAARARLRRLARLAPGAGLGAWVGRSLGRLGRAADALAHRLVYLRAGIFFLLGEREVGRMRLAGFELLGRWSPGGRRSFWRLDHSVYAFRRVPAAP